MKLKSVDDIVNAKEYTLANSEVWRQVRRRERERLWDHIMIKVYDRVYTEVLFSIQWRMR